jgi:hypothetical protein
MHSDRHTRDACHIARGFSGAMNAVQFNTAQRLLAAGKRSQQADLPANAKR